MLIGDYAEDYEAMVPFQMLLMVGHRRVALDTTDSFREVAHFKAAGGCSRGAELLLCLRLPR